MPQTQAMTAGNEGVRIFRELIEGNTRSSIHNECGTTFHLQNRFAVVQLEYEKALAFDPKNYHAQNNMGYLLLTQGKSAEAIPLFQRAIEIDPNYALAHNNLGNAYLNLGQAEAASAEYAAGLSGGRGLRHAPSEPGPGPPPAGPAGGGHRRVSDLLPPGAHGAHGCRRALQPGRHPGGAGQAAEAEAEYEQAIDVMDAGYAKALNNLGRLCFHPW